MNTNIEKQLIQLGYHSRFYDYENLFYYDFKDTKIFSANFPSYLQELGVGVFKNSTINTLYTNGMNFDCSASLFKGSEIRNIYFQNGEMYPDRDELYPNNAFKGCSSLNNDMKELLFKKGYTEGDC